MQLFHGPPFFARLPRFSLQPSRPLLCKGVKRALRIRRREFWLDGVRRQMLGHPSAIGLEPMASNGFDTRRAR
jgi:hypothetical protein